MKDKQIYLLTVIECSERIQEYIQGYSIDDFTEDRKTQDAVIRNLEIIGQAIKDYGVDELSELDPEIPWHSISGMRNVLAHEYLGIDLQLLWGTLQAQLGDLEKAVKKIAGDSLDS